MTSHPLSRHLAGLIGPTTVVVTLSESIHLEIWTENIPTVTYLNGMILFIAGLAIVRAHNVWVRGWEVLVTLAGWMLLLGGTLRMFEPQAPQASPSLATYLMIGVLGTAGIVLTMRAYLPPPTYPPNDT